MNQPLISIIITILNGEATVRECLKSIADQTFENFELVVVDGGSTDQTVLVVEESTIANKTVRVLPGAGLYAGLNEGVKLAKGRWLYFMGSDDELCNSHTLQNVANAVQSIGSQYDIIAGNVQYTRQNFIFRPQLGSPYWLRHHVHHQGMFYKRELFQNLKYDEGLRISSDYELNLKLALKKVPHYYMDAIMCRIGEDGISNTQIKRSSEEIRIIHRRLFTGLTREWIVNYFQFQRAILMTRRRLGLVNLKVKLRRLIGA